MKKERAILGLVGIIGGLIVASSLFYFYQQKEPSSKGSPSPTPQATVPNGKSLLEIEEPESQSITDKKTTTVKGKSQAYALIVLTTNSEDFAFEANEDGAFRKDVSLSEDENLITVTAYTETGTSETKELIITYTEEEF